MKLNITPAHVTDEAAVIALWKASGLVIATNNPVDDFRFAQGKVNSDILAGRNDLNQIVASTMVGHDGHRGWIYYLAVDPLFQRQGLGRQMIEAAEFWLVERGVPKLNLMVRETNSQVVGFYQKLGFDLEPRIVMGKRLTKR